jgi:predicted TIM-barrel fold metal-dependent hydrolase
MNRMTRFILALAALGLLTAQSGRTQTATPELVRPVADHHKHIGSAAATALVNSTPLPAIQLPAEFGRLIRERARVWNDTVGLARLYTDDVTAIEPSQGDTRVVRGPAAAARYMSALHSSSFRLEPIAYGLNGRSGFVTSYLRGGPGDSAAYLGTMLMVVERGADGAWRIAAETPTLNGERRFNPVTAADLIAQLEAGGLRKAVVLSLAYWFGSPRFNLPDEYARVRAENDWTARQVAQFADRLVAFCSFSPIKEYAIRELNRCASEVKMRGLKLHFGSSRVDLLNPEHLTKVRAVFAEANRLRMPIVVHARGPVYGRAQALTMLNELLPLTPDITVQIAHLWGGATFSAEALEVFADAVSARDPRMKNVYFDLTDLMAAITDSDDDLRTVAARIRQIGLGRMLWGSDMSPPGAAPRAAWVEFHAVPLTDAEFRTIANNVAPYLR